jgi:hypothetical protein
VYNAMSAFCCTALSRFFFAASIVLFALAGYLYFAPAPGLALEAAETDVEVNGCVAGQERVVHLRLYNKSRTPIRILGMGFC